MKILKKISCVVISVIIMSVSCGAFFVSAEGEATVPVVMVSGYGATPLYLNEGTEDEQQVWSPDLSAAISEMLKTSLCPLLCAGTKAAFGKLDSLVDVVGPYIASSLEYVRMTGDGVPAYNVSPRKTEVSECSLAAQMAASDGTRMGDMSGVGEKIGYENVFNFSVDWRMSQVDCAAALDEFIKDVMAYTGAEKVSIMGTSFGGEVTGTYLKKYGGTQLDNVLMSVPALGGTDIATQVLSGSGISLDTSTVFSMFSRSVDLTWLADIVDISGLNYFITKLVDRYLLDVFMNIGSLWDFVPLKDYDELRALLNDGKHSGLLAKSDELHYEIMAKHKETFASLSSLGIDISIIAGYGTGKLLTGAQVNSDSVIPVYSSTGAAAVTEGKISAPGSCDTADHKHLSPCGTVDASCGYLPERTWFIEGLLHFGMTDRDYIANLNSKLLLGDEIETVFSDANYPQFRESQKKTQQSFFARIIAFIKQLFSEILKLG